MESRAIGCEENEWKAADQNSSRSEGMSVTQPKKSKLSYLEASKAQQAHFLSASILMFQLSKE